MPIQAPQIDPRGYRQIVAQTAELARRFTGEAWRPVADGRPEAGMALIQIFAHMVELLIDRLNRTPDKNFLAFLDLIGAGPLPPTPARVPLTFFLAEGGTTGALVPAGVQVATAPAEGQAEVLFETERGLELTAARLIAAF